LEVNSIKEQTQKFKTARGNLLAVIIFTTINTLLALAKANVYMLFSATVPMALIEVGKVLADEYFMNLAFIICACIALACIGLYWLCWYLSKRKRVWMLVALILFSIDTILVLILTFLDENMSSMLLDVGFHVWILYYLISGTKAWAKLRGIDTSSFEEEQAEPEQVEEKQEEIVQVEEEK